MSEKLAVTTTKVVGYFNPQKYPIFIEISEINLKAELAPNAYIRDRHGKYINDPIFESYCHSKGLARATAPEAVPIRLVPRFVKSQRPTAAVSQATGFSREKGGRTVPNFAPAAAPAQEVPANKRSHTGMTIETARKLGLIGKPRLIPEDYGAEDSSDGHPKSNAIPTIKHSIESPPKIKSNNNLRPELEETDEELTVQQRQQRKQLQNNLKKAAATGSGEHFDPSKIRPTTARPSTPAELPESFESVPEEKPKARTRAVPIKQTPKRVLPVRAPVEPAPEPEPEPEAEQEEAPQEEPQEEGQEIAETAPAEEVIEEETESGVVQPLDESEPPVMEEPQSDPETGKRFICAADGKGFTYRSELERHVTRNFPQHMHKTLMQAYPPS